MAGKLQRLPTVAPGRLLAWRAGAVVAALLVTTLFLALSGRDPRLLADLVVRSTVGSRFGLEDLALFMTPLVLTGAAVTVTGRIGIWNIGAEGQFYAGAIGAAGIGLFVPGPAIIILPLMTVCGILCGMAWILVPTLARAYAGVNEIITTLLLNFVAGLLTTYLAVGPWHDRVTGALASTGRLPVQVPELWGVVHWGFPVALAIVLVLAAVMARTRWGYQVTISGANEQAARYAGIPVRARIVAVMLLSGGLAALAGVFEVAGTVHRLQGGLANNFGYFGIVVAVLARGSCLNVLPAALLMAFILDSGIVLQTQQLTASAVLAITGLVLFAIAIGDELAHYRPVSSRPAAAPAGPTRAESTP
ncbi:inner-membrane translocator [Gluconacetobacter diazotrophicus PA1 5]|uniref:Putative amino acid transporter n=1 Tax=Gluconacetobacter diazotrophicus (strain ATCC 49037 / DSM 5601 / CCUG 37298 / CIP 103539 / LMG 7603 / PAl5) TaxID=272568 RepID=A9H0P2_GLUDA|nr:ABC transporter permease [Gluconacetobacter diazotrophicus]ACI52880.1 inner-membrane translocator [Gluconacetobacter diazotrophicus PA1 5]TWB08975.1 nucleoside ABC transporter membrane protein [Gluconacetobacter diazotrophicus]CAP57154.1 putative amino acid transporter [Gluconacetobacter diazotrophicus PA1 5]